LNAIIDQLYNPNESDEIKALSAAFGIFMGIIPIWGFQTLAAIFFSMLFRLNKALVVIFSQISFPPMMPLIIYLSYKAGKYWMEEGFTDVAFDTKNSPLNVNKNLEQYLYGSVTFAVLAAITIGLLTYGALKAARLFKQPKAAPIFKKAL